MRQAAIAGLAAGLLGALCAAPAIAQDVDRIDRITGSTGPGGSFRPPEGVKVVSPGALVFASFDSNFDGSITPDEITAGAQGAFKVADRSGDGLITGFEQTDWAAAMADATGVFANAMTFDIDLDRSVTLAEFTAGLKRIATQVAGEDGTVAFSDLVQPLNRSNEQASSGGPGWGTLSPRVGLPGSRNVASVTGRNAD